ncbi:M24 family metallopeptidase [Winogradskyella schleiferi]|uniref:M24 family metallopeptidase n=1 Tax=Winogradskyella schleiferi TaxID=2686078 RepID=UPI0015B8AF41|nr:Xaa-Pro peptidase family protein [Winogradskyella schleiferi]
MKISKLEYKQRINSIKERLKKDKLDTLIISEEEDIYYLTGLTYKSLERLFLLIITESEVSFIVPKMELAHLKKVDHVDVIKSYWEYPAQEPERWNDILLEIVKDSKLIGIGAKTPFEILAFLNSVNLNIVENSILEEQRWIKSNTEIELIKQASRCCDISIKKLNKNAYFGMSELEVFSIGRSIQQKVIKETPFDYLATNILVAAWPSRISYQPHGIPKVSDVLVDGSHISLAFLRVNGYSAELERTFFTSKPTKKQEEAFELMMEARRRSYAVLKAGVIAEDVDLAARQFLIEQGFKENLMHRTGHGIGLGNHEGPYLAEGDKTVLKEKMVVSIEPGIYIEGVGGFRHSDTVLITKNGYEILTNCPDDINSLTFTNLKPIQKLKGNIIKKMYGI